MLIIAKNGNIVNLANVFSIEVSVCSDKYFLYAVAPDQQTNLILGEYEAVSEVNNARNRVLAAYQDGNLTCRI